MTFGGLDPAALAPLIAPLIAAAVAHVGARIAAASGPLQPPREGRSSHDQPTPSGGGLGLIAGVGAALLAAALLRAAGVDGEGARRLAGLTAIASAIAVVGLLDDLFVWSARLKFALLGAAGVAIGAIGGAPEELPLSATAGLALAPWAGLAGAALWAFTVKNAVNFMDGANGLAGGSVGIASVGLAVAAHLAGADEAALAAAALAGALFGFLPVNAPVARVFMGDAGSLFSGAWFAGASLLFVLEAPRGAVYLPPLLLLTILGDVLLTLAWHARKKIPLARPHRDHSYQMRLRRGETHHGVARSIWARSAGLAALAGAAMLGLQASGEPGWPLGALAAGSAAACWWWARDRVERRRAAA